MKILMCCADWGVPLGGNSGSSVHLRSMATALAGLGHEVRLVVNNGSGAARLPLPVTAVPYRRLWNGLRGLAEGRRRPALDVLTLTVPGEALAGGEAVAATAPRDVPAQAPEAARPGWRTRLAYERLPKVLDAVEEFLFNPRHFGRAVATAMAEFSPDAVYERYALGQTGAAWAAARRGNDQVPHLLEVNASLARERAEQGQLSGPWAWWGERKEAQLWRRSHRVFCVSRRLRDLALQAGAEPGRIRVVQNGVDTAAFTPDLPRGGLRRAIGAAPGEVLVGWLGSLSYGRGVEEFLRILAMALPGLPKVRGVVIGGGPLAERCLELTRQLGIPARVVFTGPVEHERVPSLLVDLDLAVASYPKREGFYFSPLKVAEYLACGLPVVAGATGASNPVEDGINGLLARPGDIAGWAGAVSALCVDAHRRARMGAAARRSALLGPTWERNAQVVERNIRECQREIRQGGRP